MSEITEYGFRMENDDVFSVSIMLDALRYAFSLDLGLVQNRRDAFNRITESFNTIPDMMTVDIKVLDRNSYIDEVNQILTALSTFTKDVRDKDVNVGSVSQDQLLNARYAISKLMKTLSDILKKNLYYCYLTDRMFEHRLIAMLKFLDDKPRNKWVVLNTSCVFMAQNIRERFLEYITDNGYVTLKGSLYVVTEDGLTYLKEIIKNREEGSSNPKKEI